MHAESIETLDGRLLGADGDFAGVLGRVDAISVSALERSFDWASDLVRAFLAFDVARAIGTEVGGLAGAGGFRAGGGIDVAASVRAFVRAVVRASVFAVAELEI